MCNITYLIFWEFVVDFFDKIETFLCQSEVCFLSILRLGNFFHASSQKNKYVFLLENRVSQQVLNIFRENLKSLQTLNFAFRDDTGCPNKFWIGSEMLANKVSIV